MRKVAVLLCSVFLLACTTQSAITHVDPAGAKALLDQKEAMGLFVLQTHEPFMGEIEKTDAVIEDWEHLAEHSDVLPADKSAPILVYCRSGRMSTSAVEQLRALGYTNIYHLDGGMNAWTAAGYSLNNATQ